MQKPGAVAMPISLAITDRRLSFLSSFGRLLLCESNHGARRSGPLTPRLEWQDERRRFCFPPPVGAGIHRRGVKGARPAQLQRTFSLSTHRTFSLSSDTNVSFTSRGSPLLAVRSTRMQVAVRVNNGLDGGGDRNRIDE